MLVLHGGKRSPFVRRVEITLELQGRAFERNYVNVFSDAFAAFTAINPLGRVPVLSIAPDEHLIETAAIIDYLEDTATADQRLIPVTGETRRHCLARIACANAIAEKGVALAYEVERRPPEFQWNDWRRRLTTQVQNGLVALEAMVPAGGWMNGASLDGSDIAAVCAHDFVGTIGDFQTVATPSLAALSARVNSIPKIANTCPQRPV